MNLSVFGLGSVGLVTAVCLAKQGHRVIGMDIDNAKVTQLDKGIPPFSESGLKEVLVYVLKKGLFKATVNTASAVEESVMAMICIGTPGRKNGSLDTSFLEQVCESVGDALKRKPGPFILIFRSTVTPNTLEDVAQPILEAASGKRHGKDFFIAYNPEFLREGTAIHDFTHPARIIVGCDYPGIADNVLEIYKNFKVPKIKTSIKTAEMVKYTDNCFHALKITFANEIGQICKRLGIDGCEVMEFFKSDTKLNISGAYLKPGFAFGGSCLPKDLRAINHLAGIYNLHLPMLDSILLSNRTQIVEVIERILSYKRERIGIIGFCYKPFVNDVRESPVIDVIKRLIRKGYDVLIYDHHINLSTRRYSRDEDQSNIMRRFRSHFADSLEQAISGRELIVIGSYAKEYMDIIHFCHEKQIILDLVGMEGLKKGKAQYEGIYW